MHPEQPAGLDFHLDALTAAQAESGRLYYEFLRRPEMSAGIYALPAGGTDPQSPHLEDELYVILKGRAQITVDGTRYPVKAGSLVYVAAHAAHKFHDIEEDLEILVIFAPEETLKDG